MKQIYKKLLLILFIISILLTPFILGQTYSKYLTSLNGTSNITISRWNIKVNTASIVDSSDISNNIVPVFPGTANIASNIIAPTAEGYFDLNFDFTDADVSFNYTISVSAAPESAVQDLVSTGYSIDNGETITFDSFNENISDDILLENNINSRNIRIFIKWDDNSETGLMNNLADTQSTLGQNSQAILKVNISLSQIL